MRAWPMPGSCYRILPEYREIRMDTKIDSEYIVRNATVFDAQQIYALIESDARHGNLLPRSINEIYRSIRDFFVVEHQGKIIACGALEIFTEILGEVRSLVVQEEYKGMGAGQMVTQEIINEAKSIGLLQLMALTYVPDFFHRFGFQTVPRDSLPEKVWGVCIKCYKFNHCDEIAVLLKLKEYYKNI